MEYILLSITVYLAIKCTKWTEDNSSEEGEINSVFSQLESYLCLNVIFFTEYLFLVTIWKACAHAQSCPTLCLSRDCSPVRLLCPWDFSRQEYWSGLPFPSPGDLPDPGIEPVSLASPALAGRFLTTRATREPNIMKMIWCKESENKLLLVFKSFF